MNENANDIKDIPQLANTREDRFALHVVTNPGDSNAEHARAAGVPEGSARQRGYEMANRPEIQAKIEALREKIGDINKIDIEALVKNTLVDQTMNASSDRDKQNAAHLLGKTKGMFRDVVDTTTHTPDDELLDRIEKEFGLEARKKAEAELGLNE